MNLLQLRYVVEVVRHGNHISAAAAALYTSQPGVSRQIQNLESELGFDIFVRTRNRITGLTEPGQHVVEIAERIVSDSRALSTLRNDMAATDTGALTIATTHTQAKYVLPTVIAKFMTQYPKVRVMLLQGDPEGVCELVQSGEADLAIGPDTHRSFPDLVEFPCFELPRSIVAPRGHDLLEVDELSLSEIAKYPLITHDPRYSGRWKVMEIFERAGLKPAIVLSAIDADVCKTYVRIGLGVAILTSVSMSTEHDDVLGARDVSNLFPPSTTYVRLRTNSYVRRYTLDFIHELAPHLTPEVVGERLR